jgi:hypothetical protein
MADDRRRAKRVEAIVPGFGADRDRGTADERRRGPIEGRIRRDQREAAPFIRLESKIGDQIHQLPPTLAAVDQRASQHLGRRDGDWWVGCLEVVHSGAIPESDAPLTTKWINDRLAAGLTSDNRMRRNDGLSRFASCSGGPIHVHRPGAARGGRKYPEQVDGDDNQPLSAWSARGEHAWGEAAWGRPASGGGRSARGCRRGACCPGCEPL